MQIKSSNDVVKSCSALHKAELFLSFSAGFLLENFRITFAVYLSAKLTGKLFTSSLRRKHTYPLGLRSNYTCIISFKKMLGKYSTLNEKRKM